MDVLKIIDEIEEIVENSSRIPMTGKVLLDSDTVLEYLDRIRTILPEELRQAKWVSKEKERMLKEAQEESERVLEEARQQVKRLANESEVVKQANAQAEAIIAQAKLMAKEMKNGATTYADDVLKQLEGNLEKALAVIKKGRDELKSTRVKNSL